MTRDEGLLYRILAEFFLDSLREDAGDVDNWCSQKGYSVDDTVASIEKHIEVVNL